MKKHFYQELITLFFNYKTLIIHYTTKLVYIFMESPNIPNIHKM